MRGLKFSASILAFLALAALAFGQLPLSNPVLLAEAKGEVRWTHCAFGPDGVLYVIWEEDNGAAGNFIWCASTDGVTISTPFNVSEKERVSAERPHVAAGPNGLIGVTWGQSGENSVFLRLYDSSAKAWRPIETIQQGFGYSEPVLAIDGSGNIFSTWFSDARGAQYSRAKINGVWEDTAQLSSVRTSKQGWIGVAKNGTIWCVWREKFGTGTASYKNLYNKRTKDSGWGLERIVDMGGDSVSHPHLTIGPDDTPYITFGNVVAEEELGQTMVVQKLDEAANPKETALSYGVHHFPQIAFTPNGDLYLACQFGGGDFGDGIQFTHRPAGGTTWAPPQNISSTYPKVVGCAADNFGNVAVSFSNYHITQGGSEIWIDSTQRITPIPYAPTNPALTIRLTGLRRVPGLTYNLSWTADSRNNADFQQGFNIYVMENGGSWTLLTTVAKPAQSAALTFTDVNKKRKFAITALSRFGRESAMVMF